MDASDKALAILGAIIAGLVSLIVYLGKRQQAAQERFTEKTAPRLADTFTANLAEATLVFRETIEKILAEHREEMKIEREASTKREDRLWAKIDMLTAELSRRPKDG